MSQKKRGVEVVSDIALEMKEAIIAIGGDRAWSETRQSWLSRVARAADISYRSAYSLFYQQGHEPRASTVEKIRRAAAARDQREAIVSDELSELRARIARLEAALSVEAASHVGEQGAHLDGR